MENKIYSKIIEISREIKPILKNRKNVQQGYVFRGIDDMYNSLQPLLSSAGVFVSSKVTDSKREERQSQKGGLLLWTILTVEFTFWAEDGSSVACTMIGEAMDSGDKASNKAMSTALKYALMQMFMIPTDEQIDTEYESHEPVSKQIKERGNIEEAMRELDKQTPDSIGATAKRLNYNYEWTNDEKLKLRDICSIKIAEFKEAAK